jgi:nucleoside-diphosphate-sugar epimerase
MDPRGQSYDDLSQQFLPSPPSPLSRPGRRILVTGGSGFLGRHLIQTLLGLGHELHCFDRVANAASANFNADEARVRFFLGDLRIDTALLAEACVDVDTVFHAASLTDPTASYADVWDVNVKGTAHVLDAAVAQGVRNVIYLSTTAVIFAGRDICGLSEDQCPYPRRYLDSYAATKAQAEQLVVAANGTVSPLTGEALCTVSLRPHALFGPRDQHFIAKLIARAREGDLTHRIGPGTNLVDWTYIGNVVHASVLAMERMSKPVSAIVGFQQQQQQQQQFAGPAAGAAGVGWLPESGGRQLGRGGSFAGSEGFLDEEDDEDETHGGGGGGGGGGGTDVAALDGGTTGTGAGGNDDEGDTQSEFGSAAVDRTPSLPSAATAGPLVPAPVAVVPHGAFDAEALLRRAEVGGQVFFITNGSARPFWPFLSLILNETGCVAPHKSISFPVAYAMAWLLESARWLWDLLRPLHGRPPLEASITRHMVCQMACTQYFNIDKARRLIGYEPLISLERGLEVRKAHTSNANKAGKRTQHQTEPSPCGTDRFVLFSLFSPLYVFCLLSSLRSITSSAVVTCRCGMRARRHWDMTLLHSTRLTCNNNSSNNNYNSSKCNSSSNNCSGNSNKRLSNNNTNNNCNSNSRCNRTPPSSLLRRRRNSSNNGSNNNSGRCNSNNRCIVRTHAR